LGSLLFAQPPDVAAATFDELSATIAPDPGAPAIGTASMVSDVQGVLDGRDLRFPYTDACRREGAWTAGGESAADFVTYDSRLLPVASSTGFAAASP